MKKSKKMMLNQMKYRNKKRFLKMTSYNKIKKKLKDKKKK